MMRRAGLRLGWIVGFCGLALAGCSSDDGGGGGAGMNAIAPTGAGGTVVAPGTDGATSGGNTGAATGAGGTATGAGGTGAGT
ncbi:MAG: hypothetical protein PVI30_25675, partial [Myxococcales bacterium]